MMRNTVNTKLPIDEQNEYDAVYTIGDDILNQFFYGNYSDAIKMMIKDFISPEELAAYLEDKAENYNMRVDELYNGYFTYSCFASIGQSYNEERRA